MNHTHFIEAWGQSNQRPKDTCRLPISCLEGQLHATSNLIYSHTIAVFKVKAKVTCGTCDGTGKRLYSCCGDDVTGTEAADYGICPTCKEQLDDEQTDCEDCNGKGFN